MDCFFEGINIVFFLILLLLIVFFSERTYFDDFICKLGWFKFFICTFSYICIFLSKIYGISEGSLKSFLV